MKIWDIAPKSNLILRISINDQSMDLPTTVVTSDKDGVICHAVRVNGKVVALSGNSNITLEVMLIQENKPPVLFRGAVCDTVILDSKVHYKIRCNSEGAEKNRREAFRLFVGNQGVAQMGINKKALDVIIKDVSENGFSFVTTEDIEAVLGMPVRLSFNDMDMHFTLMGIVVRKVVIEPKKILYGCKISIQNASLSKYINEKQRQQLSMNKNNSAARTKEMLEASLKEKSSVDPEVTAAIFNKDKSKVRGDEKHKRDLNTVGKDERREVFKDSHLGKKL